MCEETSCCYTNPEKLKDKPETRTQEQISTCHPNSDEHPCAEKKEDKNITKDTEYRYNAQFEMFKINLVANGTLVAFALRPSQELMHAVLLCPLVSFVLFLYWVHQGIVIRLRQTFNWPPPKLSFWQGLRRGSFFLSLFVNFFVIPFGALCLYAGEDCRFVVWIDCVLLGIMLFFAGCWFSIQYLMENNPEPNTPSGKHALKATGVKAP